jgi:dTDP-4-amino-4,6-dideoxygalactose transaminase
MTRRPETAPAPAPRVPFLDFASMHAPLRRELESAMARVLASGRYILGPEVDAFEREWAAYSGARGAVGVANGTDALQLALLASGAIVPGRGDEVVTSPLTAGYTALAILAAGAVPVFADVDPETALVTAESIERVMTPKTRALMPVHLYGQTVEMADLLALAAARGLAVIEDACQAHGAEYGLQAVAAHPAAAGKRAGALGRAGAHSFYPTKNLGGLGDGGALVSDDEELLARARVLRFGGQVRPYLHEIAGVNSRLDELQAAVLRVKLARLEAATAERRRLAARYLEGLAGTRLGLPAALAPGRHVYHLFVVRTAARDALRAHLESAGVQTLIHYPHPLHQQPAFAPYARGPLKAAESLVQSILSLPLYPGLADADVDRVIAALRSFPN